MEIFSEEIKIFVLKRKKRKLVELYPQRAILEESRKNSPLIQANDWIDHDYYERAVVESEKKNKLIMEKYGTKLPTNPLTITRTLVSRKVRDITEY